MDLNLSDEQKLIQQTARSFFADRLPLEAVRKVEQGEPVDLPGLWKEMRDLGWLDMAIPEEAGGQGGSFLDQCILLEEFGRALAPLPYRASCVEAARLLLAADKAGQHRGLVRKIGAGETIVVAAIEEAASESFPRSIQARAERAGDSYRISGRKIFVPFANVADELIVACRLPDNTVGLLLVPREHPRVSIELIPEISEDAASYEVVLDGAEVPEAAAVGLPGQVLPAIEEARQFANIALAAEMVGAMDQTLKMTVRYAQNRVQFGRPIGSFQAVQSLCVDMLEASEGSTHIVHEAAWRLAQGLPPEPYVAIARGWVAEALGTVAQNGHQVHGAIGFTLEHDMQLYSRRMLVAQAALGGLRQVASEVLQLSA